MIDREINTREGAGLGRRFLGAMSLGVLSSVSRAEQGIAPLFSLQLLKGWAGDVLHLQRVCVCVPLYVAGRTGSAGAASP